VAGGIFFGGISYAELEQSGEFFGEGFDEIINPEGDFCEE